MTREGLRRARAGARSTVLWTVIGIGACQAGLWAAMSTSFPTLRDPDYGNRIERLEALVPGPPLVLVLGSSRSALGIRPDALMSVWSRSGEAPMVFNFSRAAGGPLFELVYLRRLLDRGIHPQWLVLEVWPPYFTENNVLGRESERLDTRRLYRSDWPLVTRHVPNAAELFRRWWWDELNPWYAQRSILMDYYAPRWRRQQPFGDDFWAGLDEWGWREANEITHARYRTEMEKLAATWRPVFLDFPLSRRIDGITRELLALCREQRIAVTLLFMPEPSDLRSLYSERANQRFAEYLQALAAEYGAARIEARDWSPDEDFGDAGHFTPAGATAFTRELAERTGIPQVGQPVTLHGVP